MIIVSKPAKLGSLKIKGLNRCMGNKKTEFALRAWLAAEFRTVQ